MSVTVSRVILFLLLVGIGAGLAFFLRGKASAPTSLGTAVVEIHPRVSPGASVVSRA